MDLGNLFYRLATEGWPARAAASLVDAAKLPGDVYAGRTDPRSDEAIGRAADLAGALALGGMPAAQAGAAGIFGGRLAKTADLGALKKAERMTARGADRDDIWRETGWGQGVDTKWRFDIPDDAATVSFGAGRGVAGSGSRIQHSALAEAYPQLVGLRHSIQKGDDGGHFWGAMPSLNEPHKVMVWANSPADARRLMLHELQHAVQDIEGFTPGARPSDFEMLLPKGVSAKHPAAQDAMERAYMMGAGEVEARNVSTRADFSDVNRRFLPPWVTEDMPAAEQLVPGVDSPQAINLLYGLFDELKSARR